MLKKIVVIAVLLFTPFYLSSQTLGGDAKSSRENAFDSDFTPAASPVNDSVIESAPDEKISGETSDKKSLFPEFRAMEFCAGYNTGAAFETYRFFGSLHFLLDNEKIRFWTGLQYGPGNVDFTNTIVYWPLRFTHVKVGIGLVYNLEFFSDISMTNNLLPGIYVDYRPCSWFSFDASTSFFIKARTIYAIADTVPLLMNYSAALGLNFNFYLPYNFGLSLGLNSSEDFRYYVLGASSFSATISYTLNQAWSFYFTGTARYVDFFTLSSAYEDAEFKLSVRFAF
ncbi:MAG: hypothetical protein IKR40_09640 [Treponema sp.]|nr:hypothetical protein [Treponema sp.]